TGFVHTAPGHGSDDFEIWMDNATALEARGINPAIPFTVGPDGRFTADAPGFEGEQVITDKGEKGKANEVVIKALIGANNLFARGRLKHEYPHSWRSKKPIIFRNTPQWFVYMDKMIAEPSNARQAQGASAGQAAPAEASGNGQTAASEVKQTLRNTALKAIDDTRFVPARGQTRLRGMIEDRPDWVLSRQRAWGVPIAVFVSEDGEVLKDEAVNKRIFDAFKVEGADAWYADGAKERFLGSEHDHAKWTQVTDILDVWFDSGSTHAFCLEQRDDLKWPADLYLEGSDQHRGWFHSSLLESCGTRGRAPYDTVLTHGFTMDEQGRKMSKSLGNTVAPQDVIKQYGADILRLWVASVDYAEDQRIGPEIIKTNVDAYRKLRNTVRWMLGSLAHFKPEDKVSVADMPELEKLMLSHLARLDGVVRKGYDEFDFRRIFSALSNFMNIELSSFYFDVRKDTLYCEAPSSLKRRAALTTIDRIFDCVVSWLAPMLVFTCDEAWEQRHGEGSCVHMEQFPEVDPAWRDAGLEAKWANVMKVRSVVTGALEVERREKRMGSSLEAAPVVHIADETLASAVSNVDMAEICITSDARVEHGDGPADAWRMDEVRGVSVVPARASGTKCARSWKVSPDVGSDPEYPDVTPRDADALREWAKLGVTA
ncbi:MAG: class I tRNA ligase family protein, partial [Anderseniella sp.]